MSDVEITPNELFNREDLSIFLKMLQDEKSAILSKAEATVASGEIELDKNEMMDEVDLASVTTSQNLTLKLLDRSRKLLNEIDHAINKIESGDYGYCEGTGEPIPKRRLEVRPWCRHSVKYKEQLEKMKKNVRGVVDEEEV